MKSILNNRKVLILIFITAFVVRVWRVDNPPRSVFDERAYITHALYYAHGKSYFDAHPQLASMIFAKTLSAISPLPQLRVVQREEDISDLPYFRMRSINVILGSLLPVILYISTLLLFANPSAALAVSIFAVFDNALVTYSRFILPEMMFLTAGWGAVTVFLARKFTGQWILCGILLGAAVSVKESGWGFLGIVILGIWLLKKSAKTAFIVLATAIGIYLLVWIFFFKRFAGAGDDIFTWVEAAKPYLSYPISGKLTDILAYLPRHHQLTYSINLWYTGFTDISLPHEWVFGNQKLEWAESITLQGNPAGWKFMAVSLLLFPVLVLNSVRKKMNVEKMWILIMCWLIGAFLIMTIPYYIIGREFFLYHYLPALPFGYSLTGGLIAWRLKKYRSRNFILVLVIAVVAGFASIFRKTYGL